MFAAVKSRSVRLLALLLVAAVCHGRAEAEGARSTTVYRQALKGTVLIHARARGEPTSFGTGWVVDAPGKLLVTNHHVVGNASTVYVTFPAYRGGRVISDRRHYNLAHALRARVLDSCPRCDLAILRLESPLPEGVVALALAAAAPSPGDRIHLVGNPGASAGYWVFSTGTVRALVRKRVYYEDGQSLDAQMIETQMAMNKGDSGAAILNDEGEVVGVNSGGNFSADVRLMSWAIQLAELRPLLAEARALSAGRGTARAHANRGWRCVLKGQQDRAIEDFDRALELDDMLALAYRGRARAYYLKRDHDASLADCNRALKLSPRDAAAWNARGNAHLGKGAYRKAIADYTEALELSPANAAYRTNRGVSYLRAGRLDEAEEDLNEAIRVEPSHPRAYQERGLVRHRRGQYQKAVEDYLTALAVGPPKALVYHRLALSLKALKRYDQAARAFDRALELPYHAPGPLRRDVGHLFFELGNHDRAVALFSEAIRINPRDAEAFFLRGSAHEAKGREGSAHRDYAEAVRLKGAYARLAPLHPDRLFRVANRTAEVLKVHVRHEGETIVYTFAPGEEAYLLVDGRRLAARQVRVWAVGQTTGKVWGEHRDNDLILTLLPYRARNKSVYTLRFTNG